MALIGSILATIAAEVGAPIVRDILTKRIGPGGGELAETVIKTVAGKAGVAPEELETVSDPDLREAVVATEAETPELIALWSAGLEGQFALLKAEMKEGFWQSAWRWGWMYLLGIYWTFYLLIFPIVETLTGVSIQRVEIAVLMTLTTWFISLYMGGHTIKSLGESAINAVRTWKAAP
jgi:hypothetical protein